MVFVYGREVLKECISSNVYKLLIERREGMFCNKNRDINNMKNQIEVIEKLCELIGKYTFLSREQINTNITFLEMGVDSIVLIRLSREIEKIYGLKITIRTIYEKLNNLKAMAKFISENYKGEEKEHENNIQHKEIAQDNSRTDKDKTIYYGIENRKTLNTDHSTHSKPKAAASWQTAKVETKLREYSDVQQQHVDDLIRRYSRKTQKSKAQAQKYREYLADSKATVGFRMSIKEMLYPIAAKKTEGSRIWDLDGNEYVDITMGFGTHIFGYRPQFVLDVIQKYVDEGTQLGPRSEMVGETAKLLCEITGGERTAFINTGTEADMAVMRIVRAVTGKSKIVTFRHSYHGHSDYSLAEGQFKMSDGMIAGVTPGIPDSVLGEVIVLDYGEESALEEIEANRSDIAGVFVEPVQGKNLDLQPGEFLIDLRVLTLKLDIPLIFDEMITGFRCNLLGAQGYFGVQADIVTYGKAVGGGLPIGAIVGKAKYLDAIDGGSWNYGDQSYPEIERTFFVGTYNQHPLVIPVVNAILKKFKALGNQFQEELNRRTDRLANTLNSYFEENRIPIHVAHFASVFRFEVPENMDIFYFHMIERGVYIWELRMCFLSAAHTDEDVDYIIQAAIESAEDLRRGGFFASDVPVPKDLKYTPCEDYQALNEEQMQLCLLTNFGRNSKGSQAYNVIISLKIGGSLYFNVLKNALQKVSDRYDVLRSSIDVGKMAFKISKSTPVDIQVIDFSTCDDETKNEKVNEWIKDYNKQTFKLISKPAFEARVLKLSEEESILVLKTHHIYADGIALQIIIEELAEIYSAGCEIRMPVLRANVNSLPYEDEDDARKENLNYWLGKYSSTIRSCAPLSDYERPKKRIHQGADIQVIIDGDFWDKVSTIASENKMSIYMVLLSAFSAYMSIVSQNDDIALSIPTSGRYTEGSERVVGHYSSIIPFRMKVDKNIKFKDYLKQVADEFMEALGHQDYSFAELCNRVRERFPELVTPDIYPISQVLFNYDNMGEMPSFSETKTTIYTSHVVHYIDKDLYFNFISDKNRLILDCQYSTELYSEETMNCFIDSMRTFMVEIITTPNKVINDVEVQFRAKKLSV